VKAKLLDAIATRVNEIGDLYETDEGAYWQQLERSSQRQLTRMYSRFCREQRSSLRSPVFGLIT